MPDESLKYCLYAYHDFTCIYLLNKSLKINKITCLQKTYPDFATISSGFIKLFSNLEFDFQFSQGSASGDCPSAIINMDFYSWLGPVSDKARCEANIWVSIRKMVQSLLENFDRRATTVTLFGILVPYRGQL